MITALLPYAYIGHPLRDEEVRRSRAAQRLSIDRLQRYSLRRKEVLIIHRADNDYVRAFAQAFNASDVMVNLEHDVVPYEWALVSLIQCPHRVCAYSYMDPGLVIGYGHRVKREDGPGTRWAMPYDEWAITTTLGCAKLVPPSLPPLKLPDDVSWNWLDSAVSLWLQEHKIAVHLHWPAVSHYHAHVPSIIHDVPNVFAITHRER